MTVRGLGVLAERSLARLGDHRALEFEGRWHTAAEQHARAVALCGGLARTGAAPGDRVVVCMTNCPEDKTIASILSERGKPVSSAEATTLFSKSTVTLSGKRLPIASPPVLHAPSFVQLCIVGNSQCRVGMGWVSAAPDCGAAGCCWF